MKRILLIPLKLSAVLNSDNARIYKIALMALVLITALSTKEYRGEYESVINNKIGGILYVLFASLLFSVMFTRLKPWWPVVFALCATSLLEFIQYFRFPFMVSLTRIKVFAYLFGTSFDWGDFIYYFIGAAIALGLLLLLQYSPHTDSSN
jgi:hypothetical protein